MFRQSFVGRRRERESLHRRLQIVVGADRAPAAGTIYYTGSIKWLDRRFGRHDFTALVRDSSRVPGVDDGRAGLVVVSRSGVEPGIPADVVWGPIDILTAWQ